MPKTTVSVQLLAGPGVPVSPGFVRFRVPFRKVDSETDGVVTPAPAPQQLDANGRAIVSVDPGVWLVDEILPGYAHTRAVLVPTSSTTVNYADLDEVDNPDYIDGFGPTWATQAKQAAVEAEIAAVAAELARQAAERAAATGVRSVNNVTPDDAGNISLDVDSSPEVDSIQDAGTFGKSLLKTETEDDALALFTSLANAGGGPDPDVDYVRTVNGVAPDDEGNVVIEVGTSGGGGLDLVTLEDHHPDPANPQAEFGAAMAAAAATGRRVWLNDRDGGYPMRADLLDVHARIAGPGRIVQTQAGPALKITHSIDVAGFTATHSRALFAFYSSKSLERHSYFTAPTSELQDIQAGDLIRYQTQDYFRQKAANGDDTDAANLLAVGNSTTLKTFDAGWFKVLGFGLTITGGPDVGNADATTAQAAKDSINNATIESSSGGTATVGSSGLTAAGFKVLVLTSLSGTFEPGDTLTAAGTAVGTVSSRPYILSTADLPPFTRTGTLQLHRKLRRDLIVDIQGITFSTDVDRAVHRAGVDSPTLPKWSRNPVIDLHGVAGNAPIIDVHIFESYGTGIRLRGTRGVSIGLDHDKAPNRTDEAQAAYGYGISDGGEYTRVYRLNATAVRHAYTSMVAAREYYPTVDPAFTTPRAIMEGLLATGLSKFGNVETYDVRDPYAAGIDLHFGAWMHRFGPGRVTFSGSAGRRESESVGFQDRGWGTMVDGLTVVGGTIGVQILAHKNAAPASYTNRYTNLSLNDHGLHGVLIQGTAAAASDGTLAAGATTAATFSGWLELDGVRTRGDLLTHTIGSDFGREYQAQIGVAILQATGVKVRARRLSASGFNYAPLVVQGGSPDRIFIDDVLQDFTQSPSGVSPVRFDSKPTNNAVIYNVRALKHPANALSGNLRILAASMAFYYGAIRCLNDPTVPLLSPATPNGNATAIPIAIDPVATGGTTDTVDHSVYATTTQLAGKADLVSGKVPTSQLPQLAIMDSAIVTNEAAMLALTPTQIQRGDLAIRTDGAGTFILTTDDPSVLGNWRRLNAPTDVVTSVAGRSGNVILGKGDVGLPLVTNVAPADLPVSTATQAAITAALAGVKPRYLPAYRSGAATAADAWEERPTTDPTVIVEWIGLAPSPTANTAHAGTAGAYSNVDRRFVTTVAAPRPTA